MKLSLGIKVGTKFALPRREMCTLSLVRDHLSSDSGGPVPKINTCKNDRH